MPRQDTILLIEDNASARNSLALLLGRQGFWVPVVNDGLEALTYLKNNAVPQVILLDLMLPRLDGWQFLREIHELNLQPKPCIVVVTGAADQGIDEAKELGFDALLQKPIDVKMVVEAINRCLKR
jgi:CheY-like chemotaxis protein